MLRAGEPQRALRADPRPARCRAVRRRALSAAALGRHARRRGRHRLHRRLDRRRAAADDHRQTIDLGTLEAKGGKVTHLKLADVAEFERRAGREALRLSRGRAAPAPESRLPRRRTRSSGCARRSAPSTTSTTSAEDRRNFNNQALIHQNHCQHGWERFLPWHRAYLYEFEQNLQDFDRDIMLPYWDWTMPQYRPDDPTNGCDHSAGLQGIPHARTRPTR